MVAFTLLDQISLGGFRNRANEDRSGLAGRHAFVIDGATGLGDPFMPGGSDAAWLAQRAAESIQRRAWQGPDELLKGLAGDLIEAFAHEATRPLADRWELPCGAMMLASAEADGLRLSWIGDCRAVLRTGAGRIMAFGATAASEAEEAALVAELARTRGNPAQRYRDPAALAALRAARALALQESAARVLAPDPGFLSHVRSEHVRANHAALLLMTDGFAACELRYGLHAGPEALMAAAASHGLAPIAAGLRSFEERTDPDGLLKPRWKRSDDATALMLEFRA